MGKTGLAGESQYIFSAYAANGAFYRRLRLGRLRTGRLSPGTGLGRFGALLLVGCALAAVCVFVCGLFFGALAWFGLRAILGRFGLQAVLWRLGRSLVLTRGNLIH